MTHRGPFQPLLFCDSVTSVCIVQATRLSHVLPTQTYCIVSGTTKYPNSAVPPEVCGSPVRFGSCPASLVPARWIVLSLSKRLYNISRGNRIPCLRNWIPSTVCSIRKLSLFNSLSSGSLCRHGIGADTPAVFETQTQVQLTNDREWSILKVSIILAFQVSGKPFYSRHREFLFSFCVNRRFLHNSVWNPRYSCSLYSCLGRDLGWKVKLCIRVSFITCQKKPCCSRMLKNRIYWMKGYGKSKYLHHPS